MSFVCDKCGLVGFETWDDAFAHEKTCAGDGKRQSPTKQGGAVDCTNNATGSAQKQRAGERNLSIGKEGGTSEDAGGSGSSFRWLPTSSAGDGDDRFPRQILLSREELQNSPESSAQNLSLLDSYACQNIEVFEVTEEDLSWALSTYTGSGTERTADGPAVGKIGLRCIHCFHSSAAAGTSSSGIIYPVNVGGMSDNVRFMAEHHFSSCSATPELLQTNMSKAAASMQKDAERDAEWGRVALLEYCVAFCKRVGIVKTGMQFKYDPYALSRKQTSGRGGGTENKSDGSSSGGLMVSTDGASIAQGTEGAMMALTPLAADTSYQTPGQGPGQLKQQYTAPSTSNSAKNTNFSNQHSHHFQSPSPSHQKVNPPQQATDQSNYEGAVHGFVPNPHQRGGHSIPQPPALPPGTATFQHQSPQGFAFYHDGSVWTCQYCRNVPLVYRAPGSIIEMPSHVQPDDGLVQQHLRVCQGNSLPLQQPPMSNVPPPSQETQPVNQGNEQQMEPQYNRQQLPQYPPQGNHPSYPNQIDQQQHGAFFGTQGGQPPPYQEWGAPTNQEANPQYPHQQKTSSGENSGSYYSASLPVVPDQSHPPSYQYQPHDPPPSYGGPGMPHQGSYDCPPPPLPYYSGGIPSEGGPVQTPKRGDKNAKPTANDAALYSAIQYMNSVERGVARSSSSDASEMSGSGSHRPASELVEPGDKLLLTDYFFFIMKQLQTCYFSEDDRKTRGGKRENVAVGFAGLQCIHCSTSPKSRKFFWRNVDRIANSFAEIPGHVLKCRRCPAQTKEALKVLKSKHQEQMSKRPRGSQKVFFRRMWRRLHKDDSTLEGSEQGSPTEAGPAPTSSMSVLVSAAAAENALDSGATAKQSTVSATSGDMGELLSTPTASSTFNRTASGSSQALHNATNSSHYHPSPIIGPHEGLAGAGSFSVSGTTASAARALAGLDTGSPHSASSSEAQPRIMLAIEEDKDWLSDTDCLVRRNIEAFCATSEDVVAARADRKYPITVGQVGIRCIHCALMEKDGARDTAVSYPHTINGIYESVREFQRVHLDDCKNLTEKVRSELHKEAGAASLSSVLRRYYFMAARALGMYDTNRGIRAGGESIDVNSTAETEFTTKNVSGDSPHRSMPKLSSSKHFGNTVAGSRTLAGDFGDNGPVAMGSDTRSYMQVSTLPYESRKRKAGENSTLGTESSTEDSPKKRLHIEEV